MYKKSFLLTVFITTILTVSGCGKKEITGQIFWKSGETSRKISDTKIELYALTDYTSQNVDFSRNAELLMKALHIREFELSSAKNDTHAAMEYAKVWAEVRRAPEFSRHFDWGTYDHSIAKVKNLLNLTTERSVKLEEERKQIIEGRHHKLFLSNAIQPLAATISDADGQFKLQPPSDKKILIRASTENSSWYVEVTPSIESILLSPTNSHGSKCNECVFDRPSEDAVVKAISTHATTIPHLAETAQSSEISNTFFGESKKLMASISEYNRMSQKINASSTLASLYSRATILPELAAKQYDEKINILNAQQRQINLIKEMKILLENFITDAEQLDSVINKRLNQTAQFPNINQLHSQQFIYTQDVHDTIA